MDNDQRAAILAELARYTGQTVSWRFLRDTKDFIPEIERFHHLMTGIYKPAGSKYALSISMRQQSPYSHKDDVIFLDDGRWLMTYSPRSGGLDISDNRALVKCMDDHVPLGVFQQITDKADRERGSTYQILGLGIISNYDPQKDVFIVESADWVALDSVTQQIQDEQTRYEVHLYAQLTNEFRPFVQESRVTYSVSTVKRDSAFRHVVLQEYDYSCAVCGMKFQFNDLIEAEAAHIVPKNQDGTDDPRNGLAFCRSHHWAFDEGIFTLTDQYAVLLSPVIQFAEIRNFNLTSLEGKSIFLPQRQGVFLTKMPWSGIGRMFGKAQIKLIEIATADDSVSGDKMMVILSTGQKELIAKSVDIYLRYKKTPEASDDIDAREQRLNLYKNLLSENGLKQLTELELGQVISPLWASQMWGNKSYLVEKLIHENGLLKLRDQLSKLLWGTEDLSARYDAFRKSVKGFGTAMLAEILAFIHPDSCGIWNDKARQALKALGFTDSIPFLHKSQLHGTEYQKFNEWVATIVIELKNHGLTEMDLLQANYFFFEVAQTAKRGIADQSVILNEPPIKTEIPNHSALIDQVEAIGVALGFQTAREKQVAKGAKVDVVWQARIANLGVVMYIFEIQSHGSIDSLILNLQRAQVNQSVQRLIVVASDKDIERVSGEIASLPESFRRAVSFWKIDEVMLAASLVDELFGIINKLELVKSEFGT